MNRLGTLSKCDRLEIFQTYCFIQLHTQFCSLGINFNVCFVFYVDGGESGKIFPTFSSTRFSEQFPALNIQILLVAPNCVLSTGFREQLNTWCQSQMGDSYIIKFSPRDVVVLRKISFHCEEKEVYALKAPLAQSMPRIKSFPRRLKMKAEH